MDPLDAIDGADLGVGLLVPGQPFLSVPMHIPAPAIRVGVEIRATPLAGDPAPTLTVKLRQAAHSAATLIDRGVTSPGELQAMSAPAAALISDDVVANYFQVEIVCTGGRCNVTAYAVAR